MRKILFLCHGNICRSVAAEVIAFNYVKEHHLEDEYLISSRALSTEETGNDIYPPMKRVLEQNEKIINPHYARKVTREEMDFYDEIYYMDDENLYLLKRYFPTYLDKCFPLDPIKDIEDPWYTRNFLSVYKQIKEAIYNLFSKR